MLTVSWRWDTLVDVHMFLPPSIKPASTLLLHTLLCYKNVKLLPFLPLIRNIQVGCFSLIFLEKTTLSQIFANMVTVALYVEVRYYRL